MVASGLGRKVDIGKCIRILTDKKLDKADLKVKSVSANGSGENEADQAGEQSEHEDIDTFMRRLV